MEEQTNSRNTFTKLGKAVAVLWCFFIYFLMFQRIKVYNMVVFNSSASLFPFLGGCSGILLYVSSVLIYGPYSPCVLSSVP